ncbi:Di-copper centre-containing protein [Periconia macrospinosa]|uniref:tyrosinase n=1 Tax=Periconia macrospinosa TaxID=97972 RepID=A0A2V1DQ54_9PLEO|nr:Di-copper centre-containing protein [Periconia macrospinosa]
MNSYGFMTIKPSTYINKSKGMHFLLFSIIFILTIVVISPISSNDLRRSQHTAPILDTRQYSGVFSVLGIAGLEEQDGTAYPRLEIRELEKRKTQWNVFILGLQRFQNASQSDTLSYFQIAGIHGRPWVAWDGVAGDSNSLQHGYCQHSSALFPTWHRPYLALFEEMLYLNARQVISEFPDGKLKSNYTAALRDLRLPYWDWAAIPPTGEGSLPYSLQQPTLTVDLPTGPSEVPNPLYAFQFHSIPDWEAEDDERWKTWQQTLRHPTSLDADAVSQNHLIANMLDGNRPSMQTRVYSLLALQHEYLPMSNKLQLGDSLESIHGTIHDMVGGDGHMLWLQYSAFDPIFWLHHANVDRLIVIWQELNRDRWVSVNSTNQESSFAIPSGTVVNAQTPLKPFRKSDSSNDFWTSDAVRDWRVFGYTYNDVHNLTAQDTIISRVNALYGPNAVPRTYNNSDSTTNFNQTYGPSPPPSLPTPVAPYPPPNPNATTNHNIKRTAMTSITSTRNEKRSIALTDALSFTHRRQYTINVSLYASAIKGSLKFYFFLADPVSQLVDSWVDETDFVGVSSILATTSSSTAPDDDDGTVQGAGRKKGRYGGGRGRWGGGGSGGYGGKKVEQRKKTNTIVPLTAALEGKMRAGELGSLDENVVEKFLRARLRWRVVVANTEKPHHRYNDPAPGPAHHLQDDDGLQISVVWQEIEPARSALEFPHPVGDEHLLRAASKQEVRTGGFL